MTSSSYDACMDRLNRAQNGYVRQPVSEAASTPAGVFLIFALAVIGALLVLVLTLSVTLRNVFPMSRRLLHRECLFICFIAVYCVRLWLNLYLTVPCGPLAWLGPIMLGFASQTLASQALTAYLFTRRREMLLRRQEMSMEASSSLSVHESGPRDHPLLLKGKTSRRPFWERHFVFLTSGRFYGTLMLGTFLLSTAILWGGVSRTQPCGSAGLLSTELWTQTDARDSCNYQDSEVYFSVLLVVCLAECAGLCMLFRRIPALHGSPYGSMMIRECIHLAAWSLLCLALEIILFSIASVSITALAVLEIVMIGWGIPAIKYGELHWQTLRVVRRFGWTRASAAKDALEHQRRVSVAAADEIKTTTAAAAAATEAAVVTVAAEPEITLRQVREDEEIPPLARPSQTSLGMSLDVMRAVIYGSRVDEERISFHSFINTEYAGENLSFLEDAHRGCYKLQEMWALYFDPSSIMYVNLPDTIVRQVRADIDAGDVSLDSTRVLAKAVESVEETLFYDIFRRWFSKKA
jgi:hypothetical protein